MLEKSTFNPRFGQSNVAADQAYQGAVIGRPPEANSDAHQAFSELDRSLEVLAEAVHTIESRLSTVMHGASPSTGAAQAQSVGSSVPIIQVIEMATARTNGLSLILRQAIERLAI